MLNNYRHACLAPLAGIALLALSTSTLAKPWTELTPMEQQALSPLASNWNDFTEKRQKQLLKLAKRYPSLSAEKKLRFHSQLPTWSNLAPEQQSRAREKFKALQKESAKTTTEYPQAIP